MRTAEVKNAVLKLFPRQEFYGYDVHKVLASEGVELEISNLYRILKEMRNEGLLESRWTTSRVGPRKRMYRLSDKGQDALNDIFLDAIKTVHSFYGLYLLQLLPKINVFAQIYQLLAPTLRGDENIAFITMDYTPIHQIILQTLHQNLPKGKIFLVKPETLELDIALANVVFLDGDYDDIPLKSQYIDCIIAIGLPQPSHLTPAVTEWHRVLTPHGQLSLVTPTVLLENYDDPLTIGDFIEKHEHEIIEHGVHIDKHLLDAQIKRYFTNINAHTLVHMTILRVTEPIGKEDSQ
jgi:PadR family transcriptional regulator PadR